MQQKDNYNYTFEELQTYLYSYADLFQQDRVQDGIHLYSKNAKNIFKEMQKVNDKIKEKQEEYNKKINEKRAKMAEAIQAYAQKHRDDKNFDKNMLNDKDIDQCKKEMAQLEEQLKNAVKAEQDKFMKWEKKEMKGQNVILRNNNYISAAGKSNAIKKGLIGSGDIASFGNINIENDKKETIISGNLADIVHSVTNLLHQKAQAEEDKTKKSKIEEVIQTIINGVKNFFGIQADDQKQLKTQSDNLNQALTTIIEKYLDNNFTQVQTNLDVIKQKNEQGKRNYESDLSSDLSTSEKDDIVSQISQILDNKNYKETNKNNAKQASTSASQNTQRINESKQNNNNKNIDTTKLLNKKETDNKSQTNTSQDNNIKNAIQDKKTEISTTKQMQEEKEIPQKELEENANRNFEKESQIINDDVKERINESYVNKESDIDVHNIPDEFGKEPNIKGIKTFNVKFRPNTINAISFDMPEFVKQSTLNDKSNNNITTKNNGVKITIRNAKNNNVQEIQVPNTPTNATKETSINM